LFTNKGGGWEFPGFWAVSLIVLYLLGDGALALWPAGRDRQRGLAHAVASKH
jgi:putative oxidoreductase